MGIVLSVIDDAFDGTDAGDNLNVVAGLDAFVSSRADETLHDDGHDTGDGYDAVATMREPGAGDLVVSDSLPS